MQWCFTESFFFMPICRQPSLNMPPSKFFSWSLQVLLTRCSVVVAPVWLETTLGAHGHKEVVIPLVGDEKGAQDVCGGPRLVTTAAVRVLGHPILSCAGVTLMDVELHVLVTP